MATSAFLAPELTVTREEALTAIIASIAREQTALGRVIEAESEKLQYALDYIQNHPEESEELDKMLQLAASARAVLDLVADLQLLLKSKYILAGGDETREDVLAEPNDPDPDPDPDPATDPTATPCPPCPPCLPPELPCCIPEPPCCIPPEPRCTCCHCRKASNQHSFNLSRLQPLSALFQPPQSDGYSHSKQCAELRMHLHPRMRGHI